MKPAHLINFIVLISNIAVGMQPVVERHEAVVTTAVAQRRGSPLSQLISEAISLGDSVLSEVLHKPSHVDPKTSQSPAASSKTPSDPSSSPSSAAQPPTTSAPPAPIKSASSASSTGISSSTTTQLTSSQSVSQAASSSTTSTPVAQESSTTSHTADPTPSKGGSNHDLVIILGCVIGALAILLIAGCVWFCLRRRRKHDSTWDSEDGQSMKWDENTSVVAPEYVGTSYPIPRPSENMVENTKDRDRFYPRQEPLRYSNPITPIESRNHSCSPIMEEEDSPPHPSRDSVEMEGTPVSPLCEMPNGNETGHFAWLPMVPKKNDRRRFTTLPSQRSGVSAMDYGFGNDEIERQSQRRFTIPRRPVSAMSYRGVPQ